MTIPSFATRAKQWSSPPVDDVGYMPAKDLLKLEDDELRELIANFEQTRYGGWRNWRGRWREVLGLDTTTDKDVLDYGCGVGIEALQYARAGNNVYVADIAKDNVKLAKRVLSLAGYPAKGSFEISSTKPFIAVEDQFFDVIHCAGVLHHIPKPEPVVEFMNSILRKEGELRLMVYSDVAWEIATGTLAPEGDVYDYEEFDAFWQHWDPIGGYADWYDAEKLRHRFGQWFRLREFNQLTKNGAYAGAVLVKR